MKAHAAAPQNKPGLRLRILCTTNMFQRVAYTINQNCFAPNNMPLACITIKPPVLYRITCLRRALQCNQLTPMYTQKHASDVHDKNNPKINVYRTYNHSPKVCIQDAASLSHLPSLHLHFLPLSNQKAVSVNGRQVSSGASRPSLSVTY